VLPVNDAPVAQNGEATTAEDTAVTVTVATDIDSTDLEADCESSGGGTIVDNGDGTITFTPPLNFNGTVTVTCTVTDDDGASTASSAMIEVGVTPVNDAPVANDDSDDVNADTTVDVDVLDNDTDVDGDALSVSVISSVTPAGATAVANPDGTVTYTPPAGYDGPGSFTYRATDGNAVSNEATVSITVFPVICSTDTVSTPPGEVEGSFTRLSDSFECKRYELLADVENNGVLFQPEGDVTVTYRGVLKFAADDAPTPESGGGYTLLLRYDPTGGTTYQPVQWCINPMFDSEGLVVSATQPSDEMWCVASALTRGNIDGDLVTTFQVLGQDDPRFTR
jgi:hypothetical protein